MKIAVVSCSPFIDYVRARTLREGFSKVKDAEILIVKNERANWLRYFEVFNKLLKARFSDKPDVYVLTFRGYEMLLPLLLISGKKPIIFDEFINPIEWLIYEKHKVRPNSLIGKVFIRFYKSLVKRANVVLSDTKTHSEYSAMLNDIGIGKYSVVPVGTDEKLFYPAKTTLKKAASRSKFRVFYYGQNMTPLHGLSYLLEAAIRLRENKKIEFVIAGSNSNTKNEIARAVARGAKIKHIEWIEFNKLPNEIKKADLCLGGPFGGTIQAQRVVTNKTTQFMACAKPVIVGKNKISNIFEDEKNCLLVSQSSSHALATKILWAYNNQKTLPLIAKNGYATYKEYFSQDVVNSDCQSIIANLG